ncbi:hypothetical protein B0J11DRAFT_505715 [Dendryphion nanum]|uniref:DUF7730 domain-containing protein n=1 Tax=Dendryphion nanum TaxID=256645 RepID=A0A9P9INP8_9PLEO|nr:hypothetical protein B0J11DRAFT_505715 [Dendryphion nanum]
MPDMKENLFGRILQTIGLQRPVASGSKIPFSQLQPQQKTLALLKPCGPSQALQVFEDIYSRQASCILFAKLPIELRELIWEQIVYVGLIHMYWANRDRLRSFICAKQAECVSYSHEKNRGKQSRWGTSHEIKEDDIDEEKSAMNLLLTCRAIYFEATKILYSRNTFDFSDHWPNIRFLQWNVPLTSLANITRITTICHGMTLPTIRSEDFNCWVKMWETLALLKALSYLRIQIIVNSEFEPITRQALTDTEDEILEPVKQMRWNLRDGLRTFELILPWDANIDDGEVGPILLDWGVRITRV